MSINVNPTLLDKEYCCRKARTIINIFRIQMDEIELAQEIYAHAWVYYHIPVRWIQDHADPVDLQDGGDTAFRKLIYRIIWRIL